MRKANAFPFLNEALAERLNDLGASPANVVEKFIKGSGPGGQKINKTSSTVWLRHEPTGVEVRSQKERSQRANRLAAWADLAARLDLRVKRALAAEIAVREAERRRTRPKTRGQKKRMVEGKRVRAQRKSSRAAVRID